MLLSNRNASQAVRQAASQQQKQKYQSENVTNHQRHFPNPSVSLIQPVPAGIMDTKLQLALQIERFAINYKAWQRNHLQFKQRMNNL